MSSDTGDLLWINVGKPDDIKGTGIRSSISSHAMRTAVRLSRVQSGSSGNRKRSAKSKVKNDSRHTATTETGSSTSGLSSENDERALPRISLVPNQRVNPSKRTHSVPEKPNDNEDNEWTPLPYRLSSPRPKKALEAPLFPQRLGQYIFRYLAVCE